MHTALVNTSAWKSFRLSWEDYVKQLVIPVDDRQLLLEIKLVPSKLNDIKCKSIMKKYCIHFLLFNIVYNVCLLNISFPSNFVFKDTSGLGGYVMGSLGKRQRHNYATNADIQKKQVKKEKQSIHTQQKSDILMALELTQEEKRKNYLSNTEFCLSAMPHASLLISFSCPK